MYVVTTGLTCYHTDVRSELEDTSTPSARPSNRKSIRPYGQLALVEVELALDPDGKIYMFVVETTAAFVRAERASLTISHRESLIHFFTRGINLPI